MCLFLCRCVSIFHSLKQKHRGARGCVLLSGLSPAGRCEYSQRVAADVHHQLQRRVPVFGRFASRTALVVHFFLSAQHKMQSLRGMSTTSSSPVTFSGGEPLRHTECGPTRNATNKSSSYLMITLRQQRWWHCGAGAPRGPWRVSGGLG